MAIVEDGRKAITHYRVVERFGYDYSLVECTLETGRTHQIRVHLSSIGHPLVGDPVYGLKKEKIKAKGQLLHAYFLGFVHPTKGDYMSFRVDLPDYYLDILNKLRGKYGL